MKDFVFFNEEWNEKETTANNADISRVDRGTEVADSDKK